MRVTFLILVSPLSLLDSFSPKIDSNSFVVLLSSRHATKKEVLALRLSEV